MSRKSATAIVDLYAQDGSFLSRVDFHGDEAESEARNYANATGQIVTSGSSLVLRDLGPGSSSPASFSTFLPEGVMLNANSRLNANDADCYGSRYLLKIFVVSMSSSERSPLHSKALVLDELTFGLKIQRYHIDSPFMKLAVVVGKPEFNNSWPNEGAWMVKVVTTNYFDEAILEDWFLEDMGVVRRRNGNRRWNDTNYTLAV